MSDRPVAYTNDDWVLTDASASRALVSVAQRLRDAEAAMLRLSDDLLVERSRVDWLVRTIRDAQADASAERALHRIEEALGEYDRGQK